ncbi:MAG: DUF3784 domain-containing protein [Prevotella sp.]|nr:DUF3784 domain-containing protein [Prevotella sp.]
MSLVFALLFIVLAIIFLMGKGDMLIAGYNTMSEEERKEADIRRLRLLMAAISIFTAGFCALMQIMADDIRAEIAATGVFIVISVLFIILANIWAKKK